MFSQEATLRLEHHPHPRYRQTSEVEAVLLSRFPLPCPYPVCYANVAMTKPLRVGV